jgi:hypothetical protein
MKNAISSRMSRILAVVGGLALTGAAIGAVLAPLLLVALRAVLGGGLATTENWQLLRVVGTGAGLGAILVPATAWWLMRSVPLGSALLGTTFGTLVGGAVGVLLASVSPYVPVAGALTGYLVSALLLRRRAQRRRQVAANAGPAALRGESGEGES